MALATGDARRLKVCVVGKLRGGNPELAPTAQEKRHFHEASPALSSSLEQKAELLDDRENRYKR